MRKNTTLTTLKPTCDKCGKEQQPDSTSNHNWAVYSNNQTCECGGKFKIQF